MKNAILVYDDNCPLCSWYSSLFIRYGFLPEQGRKAFSTLDISLLQKIDFNRSRNEIPLIDTSNGTVAYGLDALLTILGDKYPWIKKAGKWKLVYWFFRRLYKLISYNRKVIVAKKCSTGAIDCAPDINYGYRFLFMLIGLMFNTLMLFPLQTNVFTPFNGSISIISLQSAHFGLVGMNCMLALTVDKKKAFEFLGQVNMLALTAILLLLPLLIIHQCVSLSDTFIWIYLIAATIVVVREYIRRMQYAGILLVNKWIVSINFVSIIAFLLFIFH